MPKRSDTLTEISKPVADRLAARSGSFKHTLSAAILALDDCSPEEREMYMALAIGARYESASDIRVKKAMLLLKEVLETTKPGEVVRILTYKETEMLEKLIAQLPEPDKIEHKTRRRSVESA